jgi:hypothetical protein
LLVLSAGIAGVLHTWRLPVIGPCLISAAPSGGYLLMSGIHTGNFTLINLVTGRLTTVTRGWRSTPVGISW